MWECIVNAWAWLASNSGQIQILIAVIALIYARKAYRKVLHQIKISDEQTYLTIQQMTKYNEERVFELRLTLKKLIGGQILELLQLDDEHNRLSQRLLILVDATKNEHSESFEAVKSMTEIDHESLSRGREFIQDRLSKNNQLVKNIAHISDISIMEKILDEVEDAQFDCAKTWRSLKNLDEKIDKIWIPMNSKNISETVKLMNNLI